MRLFHLSALFFSLGLASDYFSGCEQAPIPRSVSDAPPKPAPPLAEDIHFPAPPINPPAPVPPAPVPPPAPKPDSSIAKLTVGQIYVVNCDKPAIVLASPAGLVSITQEAGPLKIRGVFAVDGTGKPETRSYGAATSLVVTIEPTGIGRVEIIVIPAGSSSADQVRRVTLDVNDGTKPLPPPVPPTPPVPDADPALVAKIKQAAIVDLAAASDIQALGNLYTQISLALSTNDPAVKPRNFKDFLGRCVAASQAAKVSRPPALNAIRTLISAEIGDYTDAEFTAADVKALAEKCGRVGMALTTAGK
jgi:hypothetical protein